jgi:hypothetical protein
MRNEELDQIIERTYKTEPDFQLPADFAQKITLSVVRHEQWKNDLHEYLFLIAFITGILSVVGGLYYFIDKELIIRFFTFISGNAIQVILVVFLLNFILFTDRVLLRFLFSRWSRT